MVNLDSNYSLIASKELLETLAKAKTGSLRLVHMQIEDEQIKLRAVRSPGNDSWDAVYDSMVLPLLEKTTASYIFYRLDSKNSLGYEWILLTWIPDEAHVGLKIFSRS